MREGTWHGGNAQTIQVDREGYLRDGQHRLHAVLEVGTPQWFLVVRGVDPEVFPVLDIGAPRSPGDQVGVAADETGDPLLGAGMNSTQQKYAAGAVRLLERLEQTPRLPQPFAGTWAPKERLTAAEVARAFRERWAPEVVAQIPVAERIKSAHLRGGPGLWAAMLVLLHRVDPADCDRFVEQLVTGANLPAGSAVLALRFRLLPAAEGGRESRAPGAMLARVNEVARAIAYGWRAYREGPLPRVARGAIWLFGGPQRRGPLMPYGGAADSPPVGRGFFGAPRGSLDLDVEYSRYVRSRERRAAPGLLLRRGARCPG